MKKDIEYIFNKIEGITVNGLTESIFIHKEVLRTALQMTNQKMDALNESIPELFEILGMRNLSAFIGEVFVHSLVKASNGYLLKNPHQDGYPDLLIMTKEGQSLWNSLKNNSQDKNPFSPFKTGGIEIKATCGSVPSPDYFRRKGQRKPDIGQERINHITGYDWKAHHRGTNNLIGIYWDFTNEKPTICGLFFCGNLSEKDWGKIVQPKDGGGRTTSVSIMTREGVFKMYSNWIAVASDKRYTTMFDHFNRSNLIEMYLGK